MPEQVPPARNKYEYIVNLQEAEAYCGGLRHSLLLSCDVLDLTTACWCVYYA